MVQALCVKILGPGTVVFGPGPDGAREAVFEGRVAYPSTVGGWDGYIVVQAKCREQLQNNQTDALWLCQQATKDLKKFLVKNSKLRKPKYYILVSNVHLSSVPRTGGRAKVEKVLHGFKKTIGFAEAAIWSANELRAFLENASDIRRTYAAWLTPSDVLTDLVEKLGRPNLAQLLPLALARDLRDERDVRLKDAGQETEKPVFLEEVFIDLPIGSRKTDDRDGDEIDDLDEVDSKPLGKRNSSKRVEEFALARLFRLANDKLDPVSITATQGKSTQQVSTSKAPLPNRIVLLGGPGQGKSTLSQFAAQVCRARLLRNYGAIKINPQTHDAIEPVLSRASKERLSINGPSRFPLRVNLPDFADLLPFDETQESITLLSFMSRGLSRRLDIEIKPNDLRVWLGTCPSLIVLDGLDEVPLSANRRKLIEAIDGLWDDLHLAEADAVVLVTTRPQGYNYDLDPEYWQHWYLTPLSSDHARKFAALLADVRLSEPSEKKRVTQEIEKACQEETIASLLSTPLQISILFGIALLKGSIPRDRWELFDRYYVLMRDREAQKSGSIVRKFKREIDVIHQEAGFLLHVQAETAGNASAHFSPDELKRLIERLLRSEEWPENEIDQASETLKWAATHRLVLLSARVKDRITFDVRSLQEFMAAAQITGASSVALVERLRSVAATSHWSHVFRIAASKIFSVAELAHHRADVLGICHSLDNGDLGDEGRITRAGARLALDLLADGVAASAPGFHKQLLRRALHALELGSSEVSRLRDYISPSTLEIFQEELGNRLQQGKTLAAKAAWCLAVQALPINKAWAESLLQKFWPKSAADVLDNFADCLHGDLTPLIIEKLRDAQWTAGPAAAFEFARKALDKRSAPMGKFEELFVFPKGFFSEFEFRQFSRADYVRRDLEICIVGSPKEAFWASTVVSIEPSKSYSFLETNPRKLWEGVFAVAKLAERPSKVSLANALRSLDSADWLPYESLPWPLACLLKDVSQEASVEKLAECTEAGDFGDLKDWKRAERRWTEIGLKAEDLLVWNRGFYLSKDIATIGAPYFFNYSVSSVEPDVPAINYYIAAIARLTDPRKQVGVLEALTFCLGSSWRSQAHLFTKLDSAVIGLFEVLSVSETEALVTWMLRSKVAARPVEFLQRVDQTGRMTSTKKNLIWQDLDFNGLAGAFKVHPNLRGLLPFIVIALRLRSSSDQSLDDESLGSSAFLFLDSDEGPVRAAVAVLKLLSGRWNEVEVDDLVFASRNIIEFFSESFFATIVSRLPSDQDVNVNRFIRTLLMHFSELSLPITADLADLLYLHFTQQPSNMGSLAKRLALRLPLSPTRDRIYDV